jgi:hypothetical protein
MVELLIGGLVFVVVTGAVYAIGVAVVRRAGQRR